MDIEFFVVGQVGTIEYRLMPISEVAEILGYTPRYTRMLAERGEIIATKIGRCWYAYPQLITIVPLSALQDDKPHG